MNDDQKPVLVICGPTASGKTALSITLAREFHGEIINADIGGFYLPLSIGTAKPEWNKETTLHHLFDICTAPVDYSVTKYRHDVIECIHTLHARKKLPIIVGGSFFYIKSLVFPPLEILPTHEHEEQSQKRSAVHEDLWQKLYEIDPVRAEQLHKNDIYRISRALQLWERTKVKPSEQKPRFEEPCRMLWIFLEPSKEDLIKNSAARIQKMLSGDGRSKTLIEEVRPLIGTAWEEFLKTKKLIGYPEIIEWIKQGEDKERLEEVIRTIEQKTWQYARRQLIFAKKFKHELAEELKRHRSRSSIIASSPPYTNLSEAIRTYITEE
jgi:tRNA dimethylallyltransferase